jgi:hypothetical protein
MALCADEWIIVGERVGSVLLCRWHDELPVTPQVVIRRAGEAEIEGLDLIRG